MGWLLKVELVVELSLIDTVLLLVMIVSVMLTFLNDGMVFVRLVTVLVMRTLFLCWAQLLMVNKVKRGVKFIGVFRNNVNGLDHIDSDRTHVTIHKRHAPL